MTKTTTTTITKMKMSFIRIIYNLLLPHKIAFTLADLPKIMSLMHDLSEGKYVEQIERHEFEKFNTLAKRIDDRAELLPLFKEMISGKKGKDIREALFQHRVLVHSLYFGQKHVIEELIKIINEMEMQVRIMEGDTHQGYKVISVPKN